MRGGRTFVFNIILTQGKYFCTLSGTTYYFFKHWPGGYLGQKSLLEVNSRLPPSVHRWYYNMRGGGGGGGIDWHHFFKHNTYHQELLTCILCPEILIQAYCVRKYSFGQVRGRAEQSSARLYRIRQRGSHSP